MALPKYNRAPLTDVVTFDRLLVNVDAAVSEAVLHDLAVAHRDMPLRMSTVSSGLSYVAPHMLFSMRAWLLKSMHVEKGARKPFLVPKTWFDHVKHDMLGSKKNWVVWLAKQLTAPNYDTIFQEEVYETRVCPHNNTYLPEDKKHIEYLLWRDDDDRLA